MTLIYADLCIEESTTTTTGDYQLGGVPTGQRAGAQTFVAGIGTGNECLYYAYEVSGTSWEKGQGTVTDAATDTLSRARIDGSSNANAAVDWTGKTVRIELVMPARQLFTDSANTTQNLSISTSRTGNAETIAVKTGLGGDPSKTNPCRLGFQDAAGGFSMQEITAALSLTLSSGSALGATSAEPFRIWVVLFNDAGTLRLGVIKCYTGTGIVPLRDNAVASSTAEGGAGAADSAGVFYTGTAVTSKTYRILGSLDYTLTTAGTWVTAPSFANLFSPGDKLPGDVVQGNYTHYSAVDTTTAFTATADSIPQNTSGKEFMTAASLSPTASANLLVAAAAAFLSHSAIGSPKLALFRDSTANALSYAQLTQPSANYILILNSICDPVVAGSTSATVFRARGFSDTSGTLTFNGTSSSRTGGACDKSFISVEEIMV